MGVMYEMVVPFSAMVLNAVAFMEPHERPK